MFIISIEYLNIFCLRLNWNISLYINIYFVYQPGDKCDIFFLFNLIIIVIKKIVQPIGLTRPNPSMWVRLDLYEGLGWDGLGWIFFTHSNGLSQKNFIPSHPYHVPCWLPHSQSTRISLALIFSLSHPYWPITIATLQQPITSISYCSSLSCPDLTSIFHPFSLPFALAYTQKWQDKTP